MQTPGLAVFCGCVHAVQDESRSRRQLCMQRHCADSRVPLLGRARVPWGPRRQGPTPTDVSPDEESVYVDHQTGVTYNFSIIATMEWSISDRRTCIDWWKSRIDDAPGILRAHGDVHMFILPQLFTFLPGKKNDTGDGDLPTLEN